MRVFDVDPLTGQTRYFHYDSTDDSFVIYTEQDTAPVIELAKASYNQFDERAPWKGEFHHVAAIPDVIWEDLVRKGIAFDNKALLRWLDDSENRMFRVRPGKVSK